MTELMVIFAIGLLVLGPKRLPELARSMGKSLAEFRRASNDMRREFMSVADDVKIEPAPLAAPKPPAPRPAAVAPKAESSATDDAGDAATDPPRDG